MNLNGGLRRPAPAAFTLVELLVVIVIIALLASISVPAVTIAIRKAQDAAVNVEIKNLAGAIEAYKNDTGQYPPDMGNLNEVNQHLARIFPRRNPLTDPLPASLNTGPEALVFFLSGYSPDPQFPITGAGERTPYITFDMGRLTQLAAATGFTDLDGDNMPEYIPKYSQGRPYVYFDGSRGGYAGKFFQVGGAVNEARPYGSSVVVGDFVNEGGFQLIAAGQDDSYGNYSTVTAKLYPTGVGYSSDDLDNLTNFSEGLLGDAIE